MDAAFLEQASQAGSGSEGGAGGAGAAAAQLHAWEHTNHAVLAVGWGVEPQSQRKYWIAMNTWGPDWGERGFFRIARGDDESAFESMAVAADVVLPAGAAGAAGAGAAAGTVSPRSGGRRGRGGLPHRGRFRRGRADDVVRPRRYPKPQPQPWP